MGVNHNPRSSLSLLDFGQRLPGQTVSDSLASTLRHAQLAEDAGYARYWLAEHHSSRSAWASPTVMTAVVAQATRRIRVGTAGVLLNVSSAFRVACDFALLSHLFPGRIDLGIGRAWPGANGFALVGEAVPDGVQSEAVPGRADEALSVSFAGKVADVLAYLSGTVPVEHPHFGAVVVPQVQERPEVWLLGSQQESATLASRFGASLAIALFLNPAAGAEIADRYRGEFGAGGWTAAPRVAVAVAGLCAETQQGAERRARVAASPFVHAAVVGDPRACKEQLLEIAARYSADELVWLDVSPATAEREASMRLLAGAMCDQPVEDCPS